MQLEGAGAGGGDDGGEDEVNGDKRGMEERVAKRGFKI